MIQTIKDWVMSLTVCSVIGLICSYVTPGDDLKKYIKTVCCVVAAIIAIAPVAPLIAALPDIKMPEYEGGVPDNGDYQMSSKWILTQTRKNTEDGISNAVEKKFGIIPENVYIYIREDAKYPGELIAERVDITLPQGAKGREDEIKYYIEYLLACKTNVTVKEK